MSIKITYNMKKFLGILTVVVCVFVFIIKPLAEKYIQKQPTRQTTDPDRAKRGGCKEPEANASHAVVPKVHKTASHLYSQLQSSQALTIDRYNELKELFREIEQKKAISEEDRIRQNPLYEGMTPDQIRAAIRRLCFDRDLTLLNRLKMYFSYAADDCIHLMNNDTYFIIYKSYIDRDIVLKSLMDRIYDAGSDVVTASQKVFFFNIAESIHEIMQFKNFVVSSYRIDRGKQLFK